MGCGRRDYDEIEKTCSSSVELGDDPARGVRELLGRLGDLAAAGMEHVFLAPRRPWDGASLEAVAGLLPEAHAIS